ncbi:hypothetical protein PF005_g12068 [Phytophthora fragariae]|uniref:Uncharacterized protein n=1 Tax=Phytophthora fragariae TaxID=53985 RepID=A0A6A3I5C3_9STRA|nr:hypothetical protein PF011_g24167 [Phytophthora fragariae]KAE9100700.1 hypothetical protein PF010_g14723 [Phytophthora fragariae]KAE9208808.1 hypothetical protein PF005_g12068 [Phytophthora fragariae]KAE9301167.1 hypothetical protein PF001_g14579 [Phytophthora fragariae]
MVGLVRCPPLRVDSDLDRRLDGADDLDTIVYAVAHGANTPSASEDTEMEILRVDVRYHRDQLRECEAWLYKETDLRHQAESLCTLVSTERNMAKSADIIDLLKAGIEKYDKKIEEARATIRNDRLKIKKGLSNLTSCLQSFHLESRHRDRESGCLVDHSSDDALLEGVQTLLQQIRTIQLHFHILVLSYEPI